MIHYAMRRPFQFPVSSFQLSDSPLSHQSSVISLPLYQTKGWELGMVDHHH
uniref:Uncharacterized protein n=1 Tax=Nelumbo nucifera TaxID=4432 RepID=A0A822YHT7_NELNU|nr:TPA_asm: hypothetical protein HUJ06_012605 [Nelumbo nucifera]